jgi:hypothetical protein
LYLGSVDAQVHAFRRGVNEDVLQGAQPHPRAVGDGEAAGRQERADPADRGRDGGAVHLVQLGKCGMRQLVTQVDQRDQQPVGEGQFLLTADSCRPHAGTATSLTQNRFSNYRPLRRELFDQLAEMLA